MMTTFPWAPGAARRKYCARMRSRLPLASREEPVLEEASCSTCDMGDDERAAGALSACSGLSSTNGDAPSTVTSTGIDPDPTGEGDDRTHSHDESDRLDDLSCQQPAYRLHPRYPRSPSLEQKLERATGRIGLRGATGCRQSRHCCNRGRLALRARSQDREGAMAHPRRHSCAIILPPMRNIVSRWHYRDPRLRCHYRLGIRRGGDQRTCAHPCWIGGRDRQAKVRRLVDTAGMDPRAHQQRPALTLANGMVYIAYGGLDGDCSDYIGRVVASRTDGEGPLLVYTVPTPREGGIVWATPGPSVDATGNLYVSVGNGAITSGQWDHSDLVLKLSPTLHLEDAFAPTSWGQDNANDADLGSGRDLSAAREFHLCSR